MGWRTFQAVVDYSSATFADLAILLLLATAVNQDSDRAYPSEATLARWAHMRGQSKSQIRRLQKIFLRLVASGDLIVQNRDGQRSNYYIPLYPGEPGYAPTDCDGDDVAIGGKTFRNGIDAASGETHLCNGHHTPLSVGEREQLYLRDADARKKAAKRQHTPATSGGGRSQHTPATSGGGRGKTHEPPPNMAEPPPNMAEPPPNMADTPATGGAQPYIDHSLTIDDHMDRPPQFDMDEFNRWLRETHIDIRNGRERHEMIARYKREKGIPA